MLRRFIAYYEKNNLILPDDVLLLALSGGIDSMVLAQLFLRHGLKFAVAHCNFCLRGEESDTDALFVEQWCNQHSITFHLKRFDTLHYAHDHKLSVQMAARDLRYAWFDELCKQYCYDKIVIAHNANDNTETILLNFTRSAGIKGLCGMQASNGNIIRPLLFASRDEIKAYAEIANITFREDSSNRKTDYARNRIRHNVIPELCNINPSLIASAQCNAVYLSQAAQVIAKEATRVLPTICTIKGEELYIDIAALLKTDAPSFWLFEILQSYGFSGEIIQDMLEALERQAGKRFYSATHVALKDRTCIIVYKHEDKKSDAPVIIRKDCTYLETPFKMHIEKRDYTPDFIIPTDENKACLDADNLQFPLCLRLWDAGDAFIPLGMKGEKKISDFLIDNKIPLHQKKWQRVLQSGSNIVWLVGQRIDERYKVTPRTKHLLIFTKS